MVNCYVMGVGIYDESAHEIRLTSYGEPGDPLQVPKLAPEETFTWWVYQHQQPSIIRRGPDGEVRIAQPSDFCISDQGFDLNSNTITIAEMRPW